MYVFVECAPHYVAIPGVLGVLKLGVRVEVGVEMGEKSCRAGSGMLACLVRGPQAAAAASALSGEPGERRPVAE